MKIADMTEIDRILKEALKLHHAGRLADAEREYHRILAIQPDHLEASHMLGIIALMRRRPDIAAERIGRVLRINPSDPMARSNMAIALRAQGKFDESVVECREAIRLKPGLAEAYINLGLTFTEQGRFAEAADTYRHALQMQPANAKVYTCLGNALSEGGKIDESIAAHQKAIELAPDLAGAHYNLAMALLLGADFRGWAEYEWRWKFSQFSSRPRNFPQPLWRGEPLDGRTILLYAEQGFGDTIQFVRYAGMVAARGGKVILECQPQLSTLLTQLLGIETVIAAGQKLPPFDLQCPMMSLPLAFGRQPDSIPNDVPYLHADPGLAKSWAARLSEQKDNLKVGLAWAGKPSNTKDRLRSFDPAHFLPLAAISNVTFNNLQKERRPALSNPPAELHLIDHTAHLRDFADTAALMENLDLVISADTAVAHLAGAMGKPTWILLPFSPEWRWQLNRGDSPWYPTMRLFRQQSFGNWDSVFREVATELTGASRAHLERTTPG